MQADDQIIPTTYISVLITETKDKSNNYRYTFQENFLRRVIGK